MAIAPPLTLHRSGLILSLSRQWTACEAKASLSSQTAISSIFKLNCLSNFGTANTGSIPISSGSQPATDIPWKIPKGTMSFFSGRNCSAIHGRYD